jgi:hypothetical protein
MYQDWPPDALKKTAEIILEELNLERNDKKFVVDTAVHHYNAVR